jgi:hypothetical protein
LSFGASRDCDHDKGTSKQLVVCVENDGYAVSLEKRKIYVALRDAAAGKHDMLRIVDESGEDYLYPKAFFRSIALSQGVSRGSRGPCRRRSVKRVSVRLTPRTAAA